MSFFLLLNTKEDILKNDWNFATIDFQMEVNGTKQLFGSNLSSKYLPLCSAEEIQFIQVCNNLRVSKG